MQAHRFSGGSFSFEGAVSVQQTAQWAQPWRIDFARLDLFPFLKDDVGGKSSGVRLSFATDSTQLALELADCAGPLALDLFVNGALKEEYGGAPGADTVRFQPLPQGTKTVEVWLPPAQKVRLKRRSWTTPRSYAAYNPPASAGYTMAVR